MSGPATRTFSYSFTPAVPAIIRYDGFDFSDKITLDGKKYLDKMWWEYRRSGLQVDFYAGFRCSGNCTEISLSCNMALCENQGIDPDEYLESAAKYLKEQVLNDTLLMLTRSADFFDQGYNADQVLNLVFPDRKARKKREARTQAEKEELSRARRERRDKRRAAKAEKIARKANKQQAETLRLASKGSSDDSEVVA